MGMLRTLRSVVRLRRSELDRTARRLRGAANLDDLRRLAKKRLPGGVFDYIDGGAEDELTLDRNVRSFREAEFRPRVLRDMGAVDTSSMLLGRPLAFPFVTAPTGFPRIADPEGELAVVRAAARAGVPFTLSTMGTRSIEECAEVAPEGARLWFQVYTWRDRSLVQEMVERSAAAGYEALVLTVDFPVAGWRERDKRTGFSVTHPIALNPGGTPLTTEQIFAMHDPTLTWDDVHAFAEAAGMPLLLKGILRPDDAERAVDVGAAGVIVSNHGGRQLDTVLTGAEALARTSRSGWRLAT
jgi:isopentenyl diphosphate isomerase/L-lactate dehydrogenase-like FMN-dependent dehydrogenase